MGKSGYSRLFEKYKELEVENRKLKEEVKDLKKDPFKIMVPENFWEDILNKDFFDDD